MSRSHLSLTVVFVLGIAGCYNPDLSGNGGFLCTNQGPCPSGYSCVNGRCEPAGGPRPDLAPDRPWSDGPPPRPEARIDARVDGRVDGPTPPTDLPLPVDGPVSPDLPKPDGPLPLTCKLKGPAQSITGPIHAVGEHFDFEVGQGGESVVAYLGQTVMGTPVVPFLARRPGSSATWPATTPVYIDPLASPKCGPIDLQHEISVALPVPGCSDTRVVVVFRHGGGVWLATDGGSPTSFNIDSHTPSGLGLDLIPAPGWQGTKPPQTAGCAIYWVSYGAAGLGTLRLPFDLSNKMVHWFHTIDVDLANHLTQTWDGNQHYLTFVSQSQVVLRMGSGDFVDGDSDGTNDPWHLSGNIPSIIENVAQVPIKDRAVEAVEDRLVFTGQDTSMQLVVRHVEPDGAGGSITTTVAKGRLPSISVMPAHQQAVAYIDPPQGGFLVARSLGATVWSQAVQLPDASRVKVRATGKNEWEVVYRTIGVKQELRSQLIACQ